MLSQGKVVLIDFGGAVKIGQHMVEFTPIMCLDVEIDVASQEVDKVCIASTIAKGLAIDIETLNTRRSETAKKERKVYLHRAYIAQGRFKPPLTDISDSDTVELRATKLLAKYHNNEDVQSRQSVVAAAKELATAGPPSPLLASVLASIYISDGLLEDALKILYEFPKNLECLALAIQ
ncbi:hypothetical protein HDU96_008313, partial [Phlyctochytrium bullatum]